MQRWNLRRALAFLHYQQLVCPSNQVYIRTALGSKGLPWHFCGTKQLHFSRAGYAIGGYGHAEILQPWHSSEPLQLFLLLRHGPQHSLVVSPCVSAMCTGSGDQNVNISERMNRYLRFPNSVEYLTVSCKCTRSSSVPEGR